MTTIRLIIMRLCAIYHLSLAIIVMFSKSSYDAAKDGGAVTPLLVLSNPSSTSTTIQVFTTDGSATGEYCSILFYYVFIL